MLYIGVGNHPNMSDTEVAERLLEHLRAGSSDTAVGELRIPIANYFDPQHAALERDLLTHHPLVLGHASRLPGPGSFITSELMGVPLLVIRQDDGSVRAFRNICQHRGGRVENEPAGARRVFTCRYHGWTYDRDGALRNIPYGDFFAGVDRACSGLAPVAIEERHGFLWVQLDATDAIDVASHLGPELDAELTELGLGLWDLYIDESFDHAMNWKLVTDGLIDVLHPKFLHPESVGRLIETNAHVWTQFGDHGKWSMARRSLNKIRDDVPDGVDLRSYVISAYFIYPNIMLAVQPDHYEIWTVVPDETSPVASRTAIRFLVPPAASEAERSSIDKSWKILMDAVHTEDWPMAQSIQDGARHAAAATFVCGTNELPVQHFHRTLAAELAS
jgi:phenylpropionate dioxygenase-like ring-hydroxylating dioxygenase large terminal subunit